MLLGGKRDEVIKRVLSFWPTRFAMMGRREEESCGWPPTAMGRSKRKLAKKERKNLGVWEMTPDAPHWRSGARQIGLFFLSWPLRRCPCPCRKFVQLSKEQQTVAIVVSNCASQAFFQTTRDAWRRTDGRDPSRSSSACRWSPRSIEHPIASRPDDPSRPFMIYPGRPIRRGSGSGPVLLSVGDRARAP